MENYNEDVAKDGMCGYLIPQGFIEAYPTESSDFVYMYYYRSEFMENTKLDESAMLYFRYADEETYKAAKEYYLSHMTLADSDYTTYESFTFREIVGFASQQSNSKAKDVFPYCYTMAAISDEARVIVAFGSKEELLAVDLSPFSTYITSRVPYVDWKTGLLRE